VSDRPACSHRVRRRHRLELADLVRGYGDGLRFSRSLNGVQLAALRGDGQRRSRVSSQTHRGLETMAINEIRCFLAEQKYVTACGVDRELLLPDTLKDLELEFPENFIRVHRNALVSLEYIQGLQRDDSGGWVVELEGIEHRPVVSRRHLSEVKKRFLQA